MRLYKKQWFFTDFLNVCQYCIFFWCDFPRLCLFFSREIDYVIIWIDICNDERIIIVFSAVFFYEYKWAETLENQGPAVSKLWSVQQ